MHVNNCNYYCIGPQENATPYLWNPVELDNVDLHKVLSENRSNVWERHLQVGSVPDPDLDIRRGGGGGHPDP